MVLIKEKQALACIPKLVCTLVLRANKKLSALRMLGVGAARIPYNFV